MAERSDLQGRKADVAISRRTVPGRRSPIRSGARGDREAFGLGKEGRHARGQGFGAAVVAYGEGVFDHRREV